MVRYVYSVCGLYVPPSLPPSLPHSLPPSYLGLEQVERGEDKDGRLAHAGLGLADDVHAQDGLRDALVLHCRSGGREGGREGGRVSILLSS